MRKWRNGRRSGLRSQYFGVWVRVPSSAPKEKGTERCLFLLVPRHLAMPNAARCGGDFRFAPCVAGTCGSPHTPSLFVIPYSLQSKRTAPATGRGLEPNCAPGFFFAPNLRPVPADLSLLWACTIGFPKTALPESMPQSGTPKLFTLLYSLFTCPAPAFPSHSLGAPESCSPHGRRISSPAAMRDCKTPFPPHSPACRAQAHSEPVPQSGTPQLFTFPYSLFTRPALPLFPSGTDSKTKIYFVFWSLDT